MKGNHKIRLGLLALLLFLTAVELYPQPKTNTLSYQPIELNTGFKERALTANSFHLTTPVRNLSLEELKKQVTAGDLKWQPVNQPVLNLGLTDISSWVTFEVRNNENETLSFFVQSADSMTNELSVYIEQPNLETERIEMGSYRPFAEREFPHHSFIIPLKLKPQTTARIYMSYFSANAVIIELQAYEATSLWDQLRTEGIFFWIYYGCMIVMFTYNLFMYVSIREKAFLYYLFYLTGFLGVSMAFTGLGNQYIWPSLPILTNYSIPITITATIIALYYFAFEFMGMPKRDEPGTSPLRFCIGIYLAGTVVHVVDMEDAILTNIYVIGLLPVCIYAYGLMFYYALVKKNRQAKYLFVAFSIFLVGAMITSFRTLGFLPDNGITRYSYLYGSAAEIVLLALGLADRMRLLKQNMETAENKYRHLVEDASEIIFSLNSRGEFTSVNQRIRKSFGYKPEEVVGTFFLDLVHELNPEQTKFTRVLVESVLREVQASGKPASFTVPLRKKYGIEPVSATVRLTPTLFQGRGEIIGKASVSLARDNIALQYLQSENQTYYLDNYLNHAELMSHRLTYSLSHYTNAQEISLLRVCLREMLINAIEHGNLGITYEQKSKNLAEKTYFDFLRERQKQEPYRSRRVMIEYFLNNERIEYRITDQGQGFDHVQMIQRSLADANASMLEHGRGISITREVFDRVDYNSLGNQVTLIKYFSKHSGQKQGA